MKIMLVGGGTGGHFYPLIAVAEAIRSIVHNEHLLDPDLVYVGDQMFDEHALAQHKISFVKLNSGKIRRYRSILNIFGIFHTGIATLKALGIMYRVFPDVVFSKGGHISVPLVLAARFFGIPVIIHESDSVPGRANLLGAKFARKIAISYESAAKYFPKEKTAWTGNPIRKELYTSLNRGAHEYLELSANVPTILILGGSQGAQKINDVILDALPVLVNECNVIHQTGDANLEQVTRIAKTVCKDHPYFDRYKPFGHLNVLAMRMASGAADLIISRAGSTIFEIALWGKPSIIIPIPESISHDQTKNAYAYARTGAASIIEEPNLTREILLNEVRKVLTNPTARDNMIAAAKAFAREDAAHTIAKELLQVCLEHES